jgi:hypothetical protein
MEHLKIACALKSQSSAGRIADSGFAKFSRSHREPASGHARRATTVPPPFSENFPNSAPDRQLAILTLFSENISILSKGMSMG